MKNAAIDAVEQSQNYTVKTFIVHHFFSVGQGERGLSHSVTCILAQQYDINMVFPSKYFGERGEYKSTNESLFQYFLL